MIQTYMLIKKIDGYPIWTVLSGCLFSDMAMTAILHRIQDMLTRSSLRDFQTAAVCGIPAIMTPLPLSMCFMSAMQPLQSTSLAKYVAQDQLVLCA